MKEGGAREEGTRSRRSTAGPRPQPWWRPTVELTEGGAMEEGWPPTPGGRPTMAEQVAEEPEAETESQRARGMQRIWGARVEPGAPGDRGGAGSPEIHSGAEMTGISPGRTRPCTHRPEQDRERERGHQRASSGCTACTCSGRMSLKKCVFGCEGNIILFSFPKNPALRGQWMQFVFPGQQMSFSSVCWQTFVNKAQFDAEFAHRLILKDGAIPAITDPGHDSELQTVSETASNVSVLLMISAQVLVTL